jgi:hypothetical protein
MRVLFVAMPSSVHVARWINQVSDKGWDIHLFSSTGPIHPDLRNVTAYGVLAFRPKGLDPSAQLRGVWPLRRALGRLSPIFHRFAPWGLASIIR